MHTCSFTLKFGAKRSAGFALAALFASALWGCGSIGQIRAYPLYANPEQPRQPQTLARLEGPIATVDGRDVASKGTVFELLPGCHVVTLRHKIGEGVDDGAWSADLSTIVYAFRMRRGHRYSIDTSVRFGPGSQLAPGDESQVHVNVEILGAAGSTHGQLTIAAREREPTGAVVSVLPPSRGGKDIEACKSWVAEEGATNIAEPKPTTDPAAGLSATHTTE